MKKFLLIFSLQAAQIYWCHNEIIIIRKFTMDDRGSLPIKTAMEIEKVIPDYQRDFVWFR
jgi:hypothetical protein